MTTHMMNKSEKQRMHPTLDGADAKAVCDFIVDRLDEGKATDITVIDLKKRSGFTDYLIIASGTSTRHVGALAHHLALILKDHRVPARVEGDRGKGAWVVLDAKEVVVHLFAPQTRAYYALEDIWK